MQMGSWNNRKESTLDNSTRKKANLLECSRLHWKYTNDQIK